MKKQAIFAASLAVALLAGTAQADSYFSYNDDTYCQTLAEGATTMAWYREQGVTLSSLQAEIIEARAKYDEHDDTAGGVVIDYYIAAEVVYAYPRLSPNEEGNAVYHLCRQD